MNANIDISITLLYGTPLGDDAATYDTLLYRCSSLQAQLIKGFINCSTLGSTLGSTCVQVPRYNRWQNCHSGLFHISYTFLLNSTLASLWLRKL